MEIELKVKGLQELLRAKPLGKPEEEQTGPSLKRMVISEEGQGSGDAVSLEQAQQGGAAYSYAESLTKTLTEAARSITALREKQQEYTKESEKIADSKRQGRLNTEVSAIEGEIGRVADTAEVNGKNVLREGTTLTLPGQHFALGLGAATGITNALSLNISSQTDAAAAKDTLQNVVDAARITASNTEQAQSKLSAGPQGPGRVDLESGADRAPAQVEDPSQAAVVEAVEQVVAKAQPGAVDDLVDTALKSSEEEEKKKKAKPEEEE